MTKYFTIKYISAGLGHRLGHFNLLYKVGKSLGYEYVHTPFGYTGGHISERVDIEDFLRFSDGELNINDNMFKDFDIFRKYSNIITFIGETEENLYKAIHAFATADIVIKGAGSFAGKSMLFRKPSDHEPLIIKMFEKETHDRAIDSIEFIIKRGTLS